MDLLKTMRKKTGLGQQAMANLLGVTRQLYSMAEIGKRTLPADAALRFAALVPIFLHDVPLPALPDKVPDSHRSETQRLLSLAEQELFLAENDLKACMESLSEQQHLAYCLGQLENLPGLTLTRRGRQLVSQLVQDQQANPLSKLLGEWRLCHTRVELCKMAVAAYTKLLNT